MKFADYEPLPDGMPGHPEGLLWFCERHHERASALTDMTSDAALTRLRTRT